MGSKALITGVTGQDGAYLSRFLLDKGYEVTGTYRPSSSINDWRLRELGIRDRINLEPLELLEFNNIRRLIEKAEPDEIYNLAAQSFVGMSFEQPIYTSEIDAIGVLRVLETIMDMGEEIRFYQASTSEMYGNVQETMQTEETPFHPRSPYGVSKLYGYWITRNYRESYDLFASNGILFNHESPLRGEKFVTRKICKGVAEIKRGNREFISLGNLNAERDWGYAPEYVRAMWLMLDQGEPGDYVIATGETHSVRDFAEAAFQAAGYDIEWEGEEMEERGMNPETGEALVRVDPEFYRPADIHTLRGDASKARQELGWKHEVSFEQLVEDMFQAERKRVADKDS